MVKRIRTLAGALLMTAAVVSPAPGQATRLSAYARTDSSTYLVGDWITLRVDLVHPRGAVLRPVLGDSAGGFLVLERRPPVQTSDTTSTAAFVFAKYDSGLATIPPVDFSVIVPGDTAPRTVSTNPVVLTVRTVAVDTSKDIRDLKPPMAIPVSLAEMLLYGGGGVLLLALLYAAWRYWKRRKARKDGEPGYVPPPRPAHEIAFEQLAVLKGKKLWQQGLIKQYYSEATEIFRRYLENRYALQAMEETTDEILAGLRKLRFPDPMLGTAERILRRADLVKFAKFEPGIADHEEMITVIHDFVDRTKIVRMTPVPSGDEQVAAHAVD
ncbi:MAG TPA: hypothetical protein VMF59_17265 [Bacteroidota bacterium]|nr:hypothetical protein [Bacteroidota bacterium]